MSIDGYVEAGMRADCRGLRNEVRHRQKYTNDIFSYAFNSYEGTKRDLSRTEKDCVDDLFFAF